jgi:hypothetical protein
VLGRFADVAILEGYIAPEKIAPGDWLVTLAWRALSETDASYVVSVQLLDEEGRLIAQHDGLPQKGLAPTSSWLPGEVIADDHRLQVPVLTSGRYTLGVAMYDRATGQRLQTDTGVDFLTLAIFTV